MVINTAQLIMPNSSIIKTCFFTRGASTVPFFKELLPVISNLKKLLMIVPFISDAATPLGAS